MAQRFERLAGLLVIVTMAAVGCSDPASNSPDGGSDDPDDGTIRPEGDAGDTDSSCGNATIEPGEECDGSRLDGATCEGEGFLSGDLACTDECTLDTSGCVAAMCGDGEVTGDESCDGADLGGATCESLGFTGGTLVCNDGCADFDTSGCFTCGNGEVEEGEVCDDGNTEDDFTCAADCSAVCRPGFGVCDEGVSTYCDGDGETLRTEECDPLQGVTCDETLGRCTGTCSRGELGTSYIGCEYYPTVTANITHEGFSFAVAVSNTTPNDANITVTRGDMMVSTTTVTADSVEVVKLPWVPELKGPSQTEPGTTSVDSSVMVVDGAYRLRSDQPVTIYQFNPLEYQLTSCSLGDLTQCSYTNDASLLLPTHVWSDTYRLIGWPHWPNFDHSAHYAVTALEDGTTVQVAASPAGGTYKTGVNGIDATGNGTVTLDSGDVFEIFTADASADPTGTLITTDKPVQVISGHQCTNVPLNTTYCDHLEESMYPLTALSTTYVLTAPLIPTNPLRTKIRTIRIVATQPNTEVTYDPAVGGAPTTIAAPGEFIEFSTDQDVVVEANEPVVVAEYMHGQSAGGNTGDPAFALGIAKDQYRQDYLFHAPTNYEDNFVNVVAPAGAEVTLDGMTIADWETIGGSGFQVARVELDNSGDGNHRLEADRGVGVTVYGYGQYTSYWYPGGSNVEKLKLPD